ncbi:hypothetical protein N7G274_010106 [Stereocaulon virgatum]|uniref:Uncharacterized protein n=1 Tax=Stereocaulon virgatum TaxID=373712 RepID=A0ABR3ZWJ3_9LECA
MSGPLSAPLLTTITSAGTTSIFALTVVTSSINGAPTAITQTVATEASNTTDNLSASNASVLSSNSAAGASSVSAQSASSRSAADRSSSTNVASAATELAPISTSVTSITESSRTSTSSNSSAPYSSAPAAIHASSDNRLANGTVAGIVIGIALGLALVTFLATFMCMRRRSGSATKGKGGALDTDGVGQRYQDSESKGPSVTETPSGLASFDSFLPQSADDKTVHTHVKTMLDQIELHVENFYQNASSSSTRLADAELAIFNSPYLPNSLATLLPQTNNQVPLIKHALAYIATSCISTNASPDWSLLPKDFVLLPSTIRAANSTRSTKPEFSKSMSRWRVLTAYLRPNPSDDTSYIAQRDHHINEMVRKFSTAFAPWQKSKYKDEDRKRSLSAILKDAAGLGIWMFSQPSDLQFQWSKSSELGSNMLAVAPALVKLTDERGQSLREPQVVIRLATQNV